MIKLQLSSDEKDKSYIANIVQSTHKSRPLSVAMEKCLDEDGNINSLRVNNKFYQKEATNPSEIRTNNEPTRGAIDYSASNMSSINIFDTTNIQRVDSQSNNSEDINMFTVNMPDSS